MRLSIRKEFAKRGHFLNLELDYDNKSWFCDEPECDFIGDTKKELLKHKLEEGHE